MDLRSILADNRSRLTKKWIGLIFDSYSGDTQQFLRREKSRFANPVGRTVRNEVEQLYDELLKEVMDLEKVSSHLDNIIRIRAVQDFTPSQAIGFVVQLKDLIRDELDRKGHLNGILSELRTLERRVDDMALMAFDIYSQCRQKIYELRVKESMNHVSRLLQRANLLAEIPEPEPDL